MEAKLGRDVVDDLEATAGPYKWSRQELEDIKLDMKTKITSLKQGVAPVWKTDIIVEDVFAHLTKR